MSVSFFCAKTSLGCCFWVLLCLLAVLRFPANVIAQASNSNPFIWQIVVEYDIVKSNQSGTYVPGTSYKVYSQDFQTVFGDRDIYGYNERLVLDFGDGCPGTTIDDIQTLNGQVATSPSMMAQASIALIQRGGRCEFWSDKINHTQTLSEQYDLNIGAALIYNNISYNETQLVDEATSNSSYPIWSSPLPAERNINYMQDNDIKGDLGSIFMAVIFGPIQYGERLIDNYIREYSATPGVNQKLRYLQIRAFFSETSFSLDDGDNRINGSTGDNGDDGFWAVFSGDRGYLAYMIVAAAAFIVGIVLLRWCRTSRGLRSPPAQMSQEPNPLATAENGMAMQPMGASAQRNAPRHLTFEKLNELCPVLSLTEGNPKNSVCAICIEELSPASKMRILPCGHGFCVTCIDVWLTKKSSLCPICKYDCDPIVEESTTSTAATTQAEGNPASTPPVEMSDSDNHNNHQTQTSETQRSTPLQPQEQQEQQQQQQSTMEINHRQ